MNNLLQKSKNSPAKKYRIRVTKRFTSTERIETALAWLKDKISTTQLSMAIFGGKGRQSSVYYLLMMSLREAYRQGKLKETK